MNLKEPNVWINNKGEIIPAYGCSHSLQALDWIEDPITFERFDKWNEIKGNIRKHVTDFFIEHLHYIKISTHCGVGLNIQPETPEKCTRLQKQRVIDVFLQFEKPLPEGWLQI